MELGDATVWDWDATVLDAATPSLLPAGGPGRIGGVQVELVAGDITEVAADAIVNAANSSLLGGGGVDGAIHRVGGPAILAECRQLRRTTLPDGLPAGQAVATTAGDLPARWVIHVVGPVHSNREDRSHLLASCYREALAVADSLAARTVAFPSVSTGAYGWPIDDAARIAMSALLHTATDVQQAIFALFGQRAYDAYALALRNAR